MKILQIGAFPEDINFIKGGVQASVYGLSKSLQSKGYEVSIISLPVAKSGFGKIEKQNITYLNAKIFLALTIIHLPFILSKVKENHITHIHGTGLLQTLLIIMLRIKKANFVWTLHGITEKETLQKYKNNKNFANLARYLFYKTLERAAIKYAQEIIVDTAYVANEIPRKTSVIPQGIFSEEFNKTEKNKNIILSVGVLSERKGHNLTIAAFAKVKDRFPQAKLIIAGSVSDNAYYRFLQEQAFDGVEILANLPRSKIIELLAKSKIFVLHSQEESQGIAICEALANGLPVVATNVGGIPYIITHGKNGFLSEYGDIDKFADNIINLLGEDKLYKEKSENCKISATRFDWNNVTDEVLEIYRRI